MVRVLFLGLAVAIIVARARVEGFELRSEEVESKSTKNIRIGPTFRGRTLMEEIDRGRFPECQRNRTRCLDPSLSPDGPTCCFNRCVDIRTDTNHCGRCGHTCRFNQGCCQARCVNLGSDPENCGGCGVTCDDSCIFGLCAYSGEP